MVCNEKIAREFFLNQKEFIDSDPHSNYKISHGLVLKNYENTFIRLSHWATPEEIQNKKILDIGCRVGQAGAYSLYHGAKKYVGIDNDSNCIELGINNLKKYYGDKDFQMIDIDAEKFVETLDENFDIVFLGRVIHYINNLERFMKLLSKKTNHMIVIEDAHPPNFIFDYLLSHTTLSAEEQQFILNKVEYDYPSLESHYYENFFENFKNFPHNTILSKKNSFIGTGYSLGYLKIILNKENFKEDFSMYQSIKNYFPDEYGYGFYEKKDGCKEYIIRFFKESN